jgi:hypothetical protein
MLSSLAASAWVEFWLARHKRSRSAKSSKEEWLEESIGNKAHKNTRIKT